jgi:hypothetical protein
VAGIAWLPCVAEAAHVDSGRLWLDLSGGDEVRLPGRVGGELGLEAEVGWLS